jgi:hypothetical protein
MPEQLLRQAFDPLMDTVVRPVFELAWNYVDLDDTLLSFERPPSRRFISAGRVRARVHLENSIVATWCSS